MNTTWITLKSLVKRFQSLFSRSPCWLEPGSGWYRGEEIRCEKVSRDQFCSLFDWLHDEIQEERRRRVLEAEKVVLSTGSKQRVRFSNINFLPCDEEDFKAYKGPRNVAPPPWYIGYTKQFSDDVANLDRKLQGRILEAILELSRDPSTPKGDTIKPLSGDKKGLWRYRIGEFRIVYKPDRSTVSVLAVGFCSRGNVYQ